MLDPPPPASVVAALPEWLGRRPIAGEAVLVGWAEYDDAHVVTITLDPDRDPTDEVAALRQAVVDGATDLVIVAVSGVESAALDLTLRFLALAAERWQLTVAGVLLIVPPQREAPGYWRTLPAPDRYPLPPSYARTEETP
jgi:hypothetical protein